MNVEYEPHDPAGEIDAHRAAGQNTVYAEPDEFLANLSIPAPPRPQDLADLIGPFYDARGVMQWLDLTLEALSSAVADHRALAVTAADGTAIFPACQFYADGTTIPALREVLTILSGGIDDPATWAQWLCAPDDDLRGLTSAAWLAAGHDPELILTEAGPGRRALGDLTPNRCRRPIARGPAQLVRRGRNTIMQQTCVTVAQ